MRPWIFQESSYKKIIARLVDETESCRGMISKIADAIGCQRSYLSQVLHSKVQLTKDHAWSLCVFFAFSPEESRYFECLVDFERAVSPAYRKHLEREMKKLRKESEKISHFFEKSTGFSDAEATAYYSHWVPAAIHILCSISDFQDAAKISLRLGISSQEVLRALLSLQSMNLVKNEGGRWLFSSDTKFISKDSPHVFFHHQNWRQMGVEDARKPGTDGLHYTMVQSLSAADFEKLKVLVLNFIQNTKKIADPSQPEVLSALTLDFFQPRI